MPDYIVERQLYHFAKEHPDYAAGVRAALAEKATGAPAMIASVVRPNPRL